MKSAWLNEVPWRDSMLPGSAWRKCHDGTADRGGAAVPHFLPRGPCSGRHSFRRVETLLDLGFVREGMARHYSGIGRPSIDPELMIRMLLIGYLQGIRSERRLVEEVHLNLAYRWFCRLGIDGRVPERSTFSKNRHGRFAEGDLFRDGVRRRRSPMCCGRHRAGRECGRGWQFHPCRRQPVPARPGR